MKVVLLSYHSNVNKIYPKKWVDEFRNSILNQTFTDFSIMELNYGGGEERIFENSEYESKKMPSFIHAMNYLIEKALNAGADVVANSNADDIYFTNWMEVQLKYFAYGFDIVTSNFSLIKNDTLYHEHHFDKLDIKAELNKNHNIICHPTVMYNRNFLEANKYVPEEGPFEDLLLWKRAIDNYHFKIVPENLLLHRIHDNSVCKSNNR